jgi:hypothetical protein
MAILVAFHCSCDSDCLFSVGFLCSSKRPQPPRFFPSLSLGMFPLFLSQIIPNSLVIGCHRMTFSDSTGVSFHWYSLWRPPFYQERVHYPIYRFRSHSIELRKSRDQLRVSGVAKSNDVCFS